MNDNPFETRAREYDAWYDEFPNVLRSEILAVRAVLPPPGQWVEVGVGTGRFAAALGIDSGVEPADAMAVLARGRGIEVICGRAEALPLDSESMDAVFFIATLCFVRDLDLALCEAWRILRPGGCCIVALLPLDSPLGQATHAHASEDVFFKHAQLRTRSEILGALRAAGYKFKNIKEFHIRTAVMDKNTPNTRLSSIPLALCANSVPSLAPMTTPMIRGATMVGYTFP